MAQSSALQRKNASLKAGARKELQIPPDATKATPLYCDMAFCCPGARRRAISAAAADAGLGVQSFAVMVTFCGLVGSLSLMDR